MVQFDQRKPVTKMSARLNSYRVYGTTFRFGEVGFYSLDSLHNSSNLSDLFYRESYLVRAFYILKNERNKGYGTKMLEHLLETAYWTGCILFFCYSEFEMFEGDDIYHTIRRYEDCSTCVQQDFFERDLIEKAEKLKTWYEARGVKHIRFGHGITEYDNDKWMERYTGVYIPGTAKYETKAKVEKFLVNRGSN